MRKSEGNATARKRLDVYQRAIPQPSRERFFEDLEKNERVETAKLVREAVQRRKPTRTDSGRESRKACDFARGCTWGIPRDRPA